MLELLKFSFSRFFVLCDLFYIRNFKVALQIGGSKFQENFERRPYNFQKLVFGCIPCGHKFILIKISIILFIYIISG